MKILFFIESLRAGGKERRLVELLRHLGGAPEVSECHVALTRREIHYDSVRNSHVKLHYVERKFVKKDPRPFFLFYRLTRRVEPDIIHVWGNMPAVYALPTRILTGIPMVNSQITDAPRRVNLGMLDHRVTFPWSDRIVANSHAGLAAYDAPNEKSIVIYNGFDPARAEGLVPSEVVRDRLAIETPWIVGMVASFSKLKDHNTYLEAAHLVLEQRKDVTFLCVGDGDASVYREDPRNRTNNIRFLGRRKDVESIVNVCHIGVLTTNARAHGEGISNALLEFAALGKPILGTDCGGTPEIIVDGMNGYLLRPYDPANVAERILSLLADHEQRMRLGQAAAEAARTQFSIGRMVDQYRGVYRRVLRDTGRGVS